MTHSIYDLNFTKACEPVVIALIYPSPKQFEHQMTHAEDIFRQAAVLGQILADMRAHSIASDHDSSILALAKTPMAHSVTAAIFNYAAANGYSDLFINLRSECKTPIQMGGAFDKIDIEGISTDLAKLIVYSVQHQSGGFTKFNACKIVLATGLNCTRAMPAARVTSADMTRDIYQISFEIAASRALTKSKIEAA